MPGDRDSDVMMISMDGRADGGLTTEVQSGYESNCLCHDSVDAVPGLLYGVSWVRTGHRRRREEEDTMATMATRATLAEMHCTAANSCYWSWPSVLLLDDDLAAHTHHFLGLVRPLQRPQNLPVNRPGKNRGHCVSNLLPDLSRAKPVSHGECL